MRPEDMNIPKEKFVLVNENKKLKDKELVTKPVGFFMDAMHRFAKNKGSIVAAIIIGIIVLFALVVPIFSQYTVSYRDTYYRFTLPKLFNSEHIDFLDGCTNKTVNETTFLYYYSMGAETGHNAIKRQEYTVKQNDNDVNGTINMYTYREDTYQKAGTVFLTGVTPDKYEDIQVYQDKTGRQVIYPTTDLDKRPEAAQNTRDANYWYETETQGSISVPKNYTFNADGTVTFSNIYTAYVPGAMKSSSYNNAQKLSIVPKDDGFAVCFVKKAMERINKTDEEGNPIENEYVEKTDSDGKIIPDEYEEQEVTRYEYLNCYYFNGNNVTTFSDDINDASVFTYDDTYDVMKVKIMGHENSAEDGYYFFAIPAVTGANVRLVSFSKIESADYCPFSFYTNENTKVDTLVENSEYYFGTRRKNENSKLFYYGGFNSETNKFDVADASGKAKALYLADAGDNQFYINVGESKLTAYLAVTVDGNTNGVTALNNTTEATKWSYDTTLKGFYATVNGHSDVSLDGDYYLAFDYTSVENKSIKLALKSDLSEENHLYPLALYSNTTTEASKIVAGNTKYYLANRQVAITYDKYFVDGNFDGDNYTSKMRIEGSDKYLYSYARPTNGTYELRVNYFEYYIYYHTTVLKDRITQPYFLFGTTANGQDIFTCLASGARFSFALAIIVASVNLFVGAIFGAIEGYYGGKVDLIMERIVEILSAVPFMIVITLLKYHMGGTSDAIILFISFFLTGWIGMSGTVRMQFYRFKNQEYVLASRTLGAKDLRIMFKHIFPNALGTIITSCVLVIPGMIFSETSLSYLGIINLNSGSMTSVGTLLANAQPYLVSYPHMIFFPAVFISLLMLSFNLFGNGLRDAFNPSLRGTED